MLSDDSFDFAELAQYLASERRSIVMFLDKPVLERKRPSTEEFRYRRFWSGSLLSSQKTADHAIPKEFQCDCRFVVGKVRGDPAFDEMIGFVLIEEGIDLGYVFRIELPNEFHRTNALFQEFNHLCHCGINDDLFTPRLPPRPVLRLASQASIRL